MKTQKKVKCSEALETDEEMKTRFGRKFRYFVLYAEETKMQLFTSKVKAEHFIKELQGGKK